MMDAVAETAERQLAERIRTLRTKRELSLEALARSSGVSRSMISLIERAESSPTASVLNKLAVSLGVSLAALFAEEDRPDASPVARRAEQQSWRDPDSGYIRRNLSPPGLPSPLELAEIVLPPKARIAYDNGPRLAGLEQQVWIIEGAVDVTAGGAVHRLTTGDCVAMRLDQPTGFRNPGDTAARYLVAIASGKAPR